MKNIFQGEGGKKIKLLGIALISAILIVIINGIITATLRFADVPKTGRLVIGVISLVILISIIVTLSIIINQSFKLHKQFRNKKINVIGLTASILLGLFIVFCVLLFFSVLGDKTHAKSMTVKSGLAGVVWDLIIYGSAITFYSVSLGGIVKKAENYDNISPETIE